MQTLRKCFLQYVCFVLFPAFLFCQVPIKSFTTESFSPEEYNLLKEKFGKHKIIPQEFEKPILIALSYFPELENINIEFRFKHVKASFTTAPTTFSVFKKSRNRKYVVTISDSSEEILVPVQMKNLPFNAQVGVIGHELSHAADFTSKHFFGLVRQGIGHISQKYVDRFERKTDSLCIVHGLGYQLLAWSSYIRTTMNRENWTGSVNIDKGPMLREKYMNPSTIEKQISKNPIYNNAK